MEKKQEKKEVEDLQGIWKKRKEKEGSRCKRSWSSPEWG